MASERLERRLTAIIAADVAGYCRLIAEDEAGALARFRAHLDESVRPEVAAHGGRIVKTMGDGLLIEFASVVAALTCAIEIQRRIAARTAGAPEAERMLFRMGVHAGDVVVEGGDVFGDVVNVAARLQGLAAPGGVCVSARVQEDAQGRIDAAFEDAGAQHLKGIARPVHAFHLIQEGHARRAHAGLPEKPSIAVLPFDNMSGDPDQEYFADGVTEDIITALSRWRWFFVIARNSSFAYKCRAIDVTRIATELGVRYVLEGSVRKADGRVRVVAQLIDASTGAHVWSESFDRALRDLFVLQDEITEHVVAAIEPAMLHSEGARAARKPASDLSAFDCFQRGMWRLNKLTRADMNAAKALFEEAIARDREMALGHTGLARILYGFVTQGWSSDPIADLQAAEAAARAAIGLDPRDAIAHFALAGVLLYLGRHQEALDEAARSLQLNPNLAFGQFRYGQALLCMGRPREAITHLAHSLKRSPFDPQVALMLLALALAHYHAGDYEPAIARSKEALGLNYARGALVQAASLARLGRIDEARAALPPEAQGAALAGGFFMPYASTDDLQDFRDGLLLAGLDPRLAALVTARLDAPAPA